MQAVIVDENGVQLSNPFTTHHYTRGWKAYESQTLNDFSDRVTMDFDSDGFAVLAEGARRISGQSAEEGDGQYRLPAGAQVNAGDVILIEVNGQDTPLKVKAVTTDSSGTVHVTEDDDITISDLYDVYKLDCSMDLGTAAAQAGTIQMLTASASASDLSDNPSKKKLKMAKTTIGPLEFYGSGEGIIFCSFNYDKKHMGDYYDYSISVTCSLDLTVSLSSDSYTTTDSISNNPEDDEDKGLELTLLPKTPITGLKGIADCSVKITVPVSLSFDGKAEVTLHYETTHGVGGNKVDGIHEIKEKDFSFSDCELSAAFKLKLGLKVELSAELVKDLFTAKLTGKITAEGTFTLFEFKKDMKAAKEHACTVCLSGKLSVKPSLTFSVSWKVTDHLKGDLVNYNPINPDFKWDLGKCYVSVISPKDSPFGGKFHSGWGECPNCRYKAIIQTQDKDSRIVAGIPVSVFKDGKEILAGESEYTAFLYPGDYSASAEISSRTYTADFQMSEIARIVTVIEDIATLTGKAENRSDHSPARDVTVQLKDSAGKKSYYAVTDQNGKYTITVPEDDYTLTVSDDRYQTFTQKACLIRGETTQCDLALTANGLLKGIAVAAGNGDPALCDVQITCLGSSNKPLTAATDNTGYFQVYLPAGEYSVKAQKEGGYFPETRRITIREGETIETLFRMEKAAFIRYAKQDDVAAASELKFYLYDAVTMENVTDTSLAEIKGRTLTVRPGRYLLESTAEYRYKTGTGAYVYVTYTRDRYWVSAEPGQEYQVEDGSGKITYSITPDDIRHGSAQVYYGDASAATVSILEPGTDPAGKYSYGHGYAFADTPVSTDGAAFAGWKRIDRRRYPDDRNVGTTYRTDRGSEAVTIAAVWDDASGFQYAYNCDSNEYEIVHYTGDAADVTVPSEVNRHRIDRLNDTFNANKTIVSAVVPGTIGVVGNYAFYSCSSLRSCRLEYGVTTIGGAAFSKCTSLTDIVIPDSVTYIGDSAFNGCTALTSIVIPDSVSYIGRGAFEGCTNLTSIVFPDSPIYIDYNAFYSCSALTGIMIPNASCIAPAAFQRCTGLQTAEIRGAIRKIDSTVFSDCENLQKVILSSSVTEIVNSAFNGCSNLTFAETPRLSAGIMQHCPKLTTVVFPEGLTRIPDNALSECTFLKEIVIPDSVTEIGKAAFYGCTGLSRITLPDSVTEIGDSAFHGCTGLSSIMIPDSVQTIGTNAFRGCTGLTELEVPDTVLSIGDDAFTDCAALKRLVTPLLRGNMGSGCTSLTAVDLPDGVAYIRPDAFRSCSCLKSIRIPDSVKGIGSGAFKDCTGLERVEMPDSIRYIGESAFYSCNALVEADLPESLHTIGRSAFSYCTALTKAEMPDSVDTVGEYAFSDCSSLKDVRLSNALTVIGKGTFGACTALEQIVIPESVMAVYSATYSGAFNGCSALRNVTVMGKDTIFEVNTFSQCNRLESLSAPKDSKAEAWFKKYLPGVTITYLK